MSKHALVPPVGMISYTDRGTVRARDMATVGMISQTEIQVVTLPRPKSQIPDVFGVFLGMVLPARLTLTLPQFITLPQL